MRRILGKILKFPIKFFHFFLFKINYLYAKSLAPAVVYAPPENFGRGVKIQLFIDFVSEFTGLVLLVFIFSVIGFITVIKFFVKIITKKRKKTQTQPIKSQSSSDNS